MKKIILYILTFVSTILLLIPYCIAKVIGIFVVVVTLAANWHFDKKNQKKIEELERNAENHDEILSVQKTEDGTWKSSTYDCGEY